MEFTDENKQTILDLLSTGQRQAAISFISTTYRVSEADAQKLLAAFEAQFHTVIQRAPTPITNTLSGCSGCLSRILKVIAVLIALLGIGTFGIGYFMPDLMAMLARNFSSSPNLYVPVTVVDQYYYATPDSSNVRLIFEIPYNNQVAYDTSNIIYSANMYSKGDTLRVQADQLSVFKPLTDQAIQSEFQKGIYILGGALLFIAFIFWLVGEKFS